MVQGVRPAYAIESVDNALRLLLLLRSRTELRVSESARELGVARSTAHRLLAMLDYHGFVQHDEATHTYRSGPALVAIGLSAVRSMDIRLEARPYMEQLSHQVGETVMLMVPVGPDVLFVDSVESHRALRVAGRTGLLRPAHCTSAGKAMLATLPRHRLHQLYPEEQLEQLTSKSIPTRAQLEEELAITRERGYGLNLGESDPELVAVGVAIPGATPPGLAGLGISAPATRVGPAPIEQLAQAAMETVRQLVAARP